MLSMLMPPQLDHLTADELRQLVQGLSLHVTHQDELIGKKDQELHWRQTKIDKLMHELDEAATRRSPLSEPSDIFCTFTPSPLREVILQYFVRINQHDERFFRAL
jgi:hypothetical protein